MDKKPISEAKLEANRRNAQLSTGPKTEAGKSASSQNSRTHGLTALTVPILARDRARFKQFTERVIEHYEATDPIEKDLVDRMLLARWHAAVAERMLSGYVDIAECPDLPEPKRLTERYRNRRLAAAMIKDAGQNAFAKILRYKESSNRDAARAQAILIEYQHPSPRRKPSEPRDETKPTLAQFGNPPNPYHRKLYRSLIRAAQRPTGRFKVPPQPPLRLSS